MKKYLVGKGKNACFSRKMIKVVLVYAETSQNICQWGKKIKLDFWWIYWIVVKTSINFIFLNPLEDIFAYFRHKHNSFSYFSEKQDYMRHLLL